MRSVDEKLDGGDRRSIGRVKEIVSELGEDPVLLFPPGSPIACSSMILQVACVLPMGLKK